MESNKTEARRAMDIAEKKLSQNDYLGAKKFINKAQNLYLKLDNLEQMLMMIDVYIAASKNGKGKEADWYGILGVDPLADEETVKKQYKKLALFIHPDKNKFHGAEEAFKLVLEAWSLLSDKAKRIAYDEKLKSEQVTSKKSWKKQKEPYQEPKREEDSTFWTACNRCRTFCEYGRGNYLNKTVSCPNCGQYFVAAEIMKPNIRFSNLYQQEEQSSGNSQPTRKNTSDASSACDSANFANGAGGKVHRGIEEIAAAVASGDPKFYS